MHPQFTPQDESRFWSKVDRSGGPDACWLWTAATLGFGYGRFWVNGGDVGAHRMSYLLAYGEIPEGMCVCHNCPAGDNPSCVNPRHLWLGSNEDNLKDMWEKGRANLSGKVHGEAHRSARLTEADVRDIRQRYTGKHGQISALSREFGIDTKSMWKVVFRESWGHVEDEELVIAAVRKNRLTEADVVAIRHRYATGTVRQEDLAAEFGVSKPAIQAIVSRRNWKHVE